MGTRRVVVPAGEKKGRSVMATFEVVNSETVPGFWRIIHDGDSLAIIDIGEHRWFTLKECLTSPFIEKEALPELIVRAVNSHDALVAALEDLADVQNGPPLLKYEEAWNAAMAKVWAALALAKGADRD